MVGTVAIKVFKTGDHWTATQAWLNKEALINYSTPVAVGSYFYGVGPRADLACYAIATGARTWTREGEIATSADKAFAGFAVVGSNVFCLTDGGTLILYRAEAKQFSELGRSQVCGANWCNPAISNGRMFVRDRRELICVSLK